MNFSEYHRTVNHDSIYPEKGANLILVALGLAEEAGEAAGVVKKAYRDNEGDITVLDYRERLKKELGDALWYISTVAWEAGLDLDDIAKTNLAKLADRRVRGVESGFGDNR